MTLLHNILLISHAACLENINLGTQLMHQISSMDNLDILPKDNHQPKDKPLQGQQQKGHITSKYTSHQIRLKNKGLGGGLVGGRGGGGGGGGDYLISSKSLNDKK